MNPARGICLVKKAETSESLPGCVIVIPDAARERLAADQYEVLGVGNWEVCDDWEECPRSHYWLPARFSDDGRDAYHPTDARLKNGAWILAEPRSLIDAGDGTFFVRQSQIAGVFVETED